MWESTCKTTLIMNKIVIIDKIIFCFLWLFASSHAEQGQSWITNTHDNTNISAENTNNHGSIHSGINAECANSGAIKPTNAKTIGKTQQNKCGKIDAIIPRFTALFFIFLTFGVANASVASPAELESASNP